MKSVRAVAPKAKRIVPGTGRKTSEAHVPAAEGDAFGGGLERVQRLSGPHRSAEAQPSAEGQMRGGTEMKAISGMKGHAGGTQQEACDRRPATRRGGGSTGQPDVRCG